MNDLAAAMKGAISVKEDGEFYRLGEHSIAESIAHAEGHEVPQVDTSSGDIEFYYASCNVQIGVYHCNHEGHAEIKIWAGEGELTRGLAWQDIRLLSQNSVQGLIRELGTELPHIPWKDMLKYVAWKTILFARQGEPFETIWPDPDADLSPEYLLDPILPLNHPTVLYGSYSSFKSTMALLMAYIAQLPYHGNGLGMVPGQGKDSCKCLYLDGEDASGSFGKRWGGIQQGFGVQADMPLQYRRMTQALHDMVPELQDYIAKENIRLLIIDSLGPAARGNLNDPEPAIRYHDALRKLGTTSLTLAHTSKNQQEPGRTSIFGSVFFTNLSRSVWEAQAEHDVGDNMGIVTLKHQKANLSKLHMPMAYQVSFSETDISFKRVDADRANLPAGLQIKLELRSGAMTVKQLSDNLELPEATTRKAVQRLYSKDVVLKVGKIEGQDVWGLRVTD